ncbi:MAG: hypothetical protein ACRC9R_03175 [Enterovibrio sp.]
MKKSVIGAALFSLAAFIGASNTPALAETNGSNNYKAGPPVECKLTDGHVRYVPAQICERHTKM